jgi:hypothetical protein|tara:strand:+ start:800 stop:961 length:162 start_codon:yes stop_codon:yes gene_type:complete
MNKLQKHFNGAVLMNETATKDAAVNAALTAMSARNFKPQEINRYGIWYISDRH